MVGGHHGQINYRLILTGLVSEVWLNALGMLLTLFWKGFVIRSLYYDNCITQKKCNLGSSLHGLVKFCLFPLFRHLYMFTMFPAFFLFALYTCMSYILYQLCSTLAWLMFKKVYFSHSLTHLVNSSSSTLKSSIWKLSSAKFLMTYTFSLKTFG